MGQEKTFSRSFSNINPLNLLLVKLSIIMIWIICLTKGKPVKDYLVNGEKVKPSSSITLASASRRFGPQFWGQSEKYIQLCEHICTNDPNEGQKYCNCSPEPLMETNEERSQQQPHQNKEQDSKKLPYHQHQSQQSKILEETIQMPHVNYLGSNEATHMCNYLCTEDQVEAMKYCTCQNLNNIADNNNNVNYNNGHAANQVMASSEQITSEQQQLTLADYLKVDPSAERQLCSYLCTDNSLKLGTQFCNCKTKTAQKVNKPMVNNSQQSIKLKLISELGKPNLTSNPLAIKDLLNAAVDSNHRKELCSYVCALDPKEGDDNQCNCPKNTAQPETTKASKSRFQLNPWKSIKKWFG